MLHLLAEYRISEHYPCSCRLDMADSRRLKDRSVGEQFDKMTTYDAERRFDDHETSGLWREDACEMRDIYRLPRVGSLSKSYTSDFNTGTHILYRRGPVGFAPIARTLLHALLAGSCPRHLITGRRNLSRLHLERRGHTLDEQGWCGADAVSARDLARDLKGQPRALQRQPWHQEHAFRFNRP